MKKNIKYLIPLLLIAGCAEMNDPNQVQPEGPAAGFISTKVTNTPDDAVEGMLLAKASGNSLELATSEIPSLEILSIEKAFHATSMNAEKLARHGLDNWYVIRFKEGATLELAAKAVAESPAISKIQFNKKLRLSDGDRAVSYRASGIPAFGDADFNDPMLVDQWHYINRGSASLTPTVREGADINVKDAISYCGCSR